MSETILTRELVRKYLIYDLSTGVFTRNKASGGVKAGAIVGSARKDGYTHIGIGRQRALTHRLAFYYVLGWAPEEVDHINHDRSDNRWINLRATNKQGNQKNASIQASNTSGVCGVSWQKTTKQWYAYITVDRKRIHIGCSKRKDEAIAMRHEANIKHGFHKNHGAKK